MSPRSRRGQVTEVGARASRLQRDTRSGALTIVPSDQVPWADLQTLFGSRGDPSRCWCQRFRMSPGETWRSEGPEELAAPLREQASGGQPEADAPSGLVAYDDDEPVGWCAVAPRPVHLRLLRNNRVPWEGRQEDKSDGGVWAVTCFLTRAGYGRRGLTHALADAAVHFARERGARVIEGYPDIVEGGHVGTRAAFVQAGFVEVHQPTTRRVVMRLDL